MKTAISIPDKIYEKAEYLARKKGVSRSQLYVLAITKLIGLEEKQSITEQLNKVYEKPVFDQRIEAAGLNDLPREDW